ncbi:MAG TPA: hypothetical protein PKO15_10310 [Fibrobacteria bacterium]|nr:hypothetical protein [Fibrobacteria bacterium]HOX51246.1 hypothetical protein [Fibrobacteria bacterium]
MSPNPNHLPQALGAAIALLILAQTADATPRARSWRSLGMGNAGVAIADDGEALHLNPAGLTQLGGKGTFQPLDTLGYKRNRVDCWILGLGMDPNPRTLLKAYRFYDRNDSTISAGEKDQKALLKDRQFLNEIYQFDRLPIPLRTNLDLMLAFRNYGVALWSQDDFTFQFDRGALTPKVAVELSSTTALELATSRAFLDDRLSLGFGYRILSISRQTREYDIMELSSDSALEENGRDLYEESSSDLRKSEEWGHGIDLGVLWFQKPGLRYGASLQNLGMKQHGQFLTPNLSVGVAWSPRFIQSNRAWSRKLNFAIGLDNLLDDTLGYKPLSKLNMGAEYEMTFIPYVFAGRLSGGLMGGYPTFGTSVTLLSILRGDLLTYAEEGGHFTGDKENRYWMARVGIGF